MNSQNNPPSKRELHTRYWFAMASLLLTFAYLFWMDVNRENALVIVQAAFGYLGAVSLGFGLAKATEYWGRGEFDKAARHTRIKYASVSVLLSFIYLFTVDTPNPQVEQAVFAFLGSVAIGLGASKTTEHLRK